MVIVNTGYRQHPWYEVNPGVKHEVKDIVDLVYSLKWSPFQSILKAARWQWKLTVFGVVMVGYSMCDIYTQSRTEMAGWLTFWRYFQ